MYFGFFFSGLAYLTDLIINQFLQVKIIRYVAEKSMYRTGKLAIDTFKEVVSNCVNIFKYNAINRPGYIRDLKTSLDFGFDALQQNLLTDKELSNQLNHISIAVRIFFFFLNSRIKISLTFFFVTTS